MSNFTGNPRDSKRRGKMTTQRLAMLSLLAAAAVIFSYVEMLIPFNMFGLFGFKIGLSNIAVIWVLYEFGLAGALSVAIVKSLAVAMAFSGIYGFAFSVVGGLLSVFVMCAVRRCSRLSIYSVSVCGAAAHNIGQLCVAATVTESAMVAAYLPFLLVCSLVCGIVMSIISAFVIGVFNKHCSNI